MDNEHTLLKTNGYLALIGGIATFLFRIVKWTLFFSNDHFSSDYDYVASAVIIFGILMLLTAVVRILTFIFSLIWLSNFSNDKRVTAAAPILVIVAFGISFLFYFGIVADILTIVSGALYLYAFKKIEQEPAYPKKGIPTLNNAYYNTYVAPQNQFTSQAAPTNPVNQAGNVNQNFTNPAPTEPVQNVTANPTTPTNPINPTENVNQNFTNPTPAEPVQNVTANPTAPTNPVNPTENLEQNLDNQ